MPRSDLDAGRATQRRVLGHGLVALLLLAAASALWIQRIHVERPQARGGVSWDLEAYYHPHTLYLHRELRRGSLPLWNPHQLAGAPLLAIHMPAALYPPNLLLLSLFRAERALELHAILHLALAGFFTWLFLGRLGLVPLARLGGAVAFLFSGRLVILVYWPSFLATVAWLPAILWALHGLLTEARPRWALALSLAASFALLGGYAQGFVYEAQLGLVYGLFGWLALARGRRRRSLALAALAGLLVLGLTAIQVLPALELTRAAGRGPGGLSLEDAAMMPISPNRLWLGLLGRRDPEDWIPLALPLLTLPLALAGLADRPRRGHWLFFALAGAVAAGLMLGQQTPLFGLYFRLPFGGAFRVPERFDFVYCFCAAALIGIGIQGVLAIAERLRVSPSRARLLGLLLVLLISGDAVARAELPYAHVALGSPSLEADDAWIGELKQRAGLDRVFLQTLPWPEPPALNPKLGEAEGLFVVPDYESLLPKPYHDYFGAGSDPLWKGGVDLVGRHARLPPRVAIRLLDLMSVRFYLVEPRIGGLGLRLLEQQLGAPAVQVGGGSLIERSGALPRAYAVFRTLRVRDERAARDGVRSPGFPSDRMAVVAADGPLLRGRRGEARVSITSYQAEEVRIDASCSERCLVVLTDLDHPGWRATVDGARSPIHRVNTLFRGVVLEPGRHEIGFRYEPLSFRAGAVLSLTTLVALAAAGLVSAWRLHYLPAARG